MRNFFISLVRGFEEKSPYLQWSFILLLVLLLGGVDYLIGYEISFSIFYTLPVSLAAFALGKRSGIFFSFLCGCVWLLADWLAGQTYSSLLIAFWNALTRILFFLLITILLAELRNALDAQRALARTDFTTSLLNSRAFYEAIARELARTQRYPHPTTLIYLDVDNFKTINDLYGHLAGDDLLRQVAQILARNTRVSDFTARLGGDEFALLLPQTSADAAQILIPRLHDDLRTAMRLHPLPITFSLGVLTFSPPVISVDDLLKHADDLLYEVKRGGKNGVAYAVYPEEATRNEDCGASSHTTRAPQ
ncbi:MAG TPA: GGDEF domain-containing protein [Anaerolineales bacterium]|nr:GGDEF domain-containing protein [Anaerolineales bacterium]